VEEVLGRKLSPEELAPEVIRRLTHAW
jgi:hypothetical protein